jgi:Uma2 family endonuclease
MAITGQRLTLEDFLALPEEKPALEYFDGVVTQKVAPKGRHSWLQYELSNYFNASARHRKLVIALPELRTTYAGSSPVPDVAVYRRDRVPWGPGGEVPDDFYEPPDIAVEIISPEQSKVKLTEKCEWYVAHGVPIALLVDPDDLSVTLFRPGEPPAVLRGADTIDFAPILPGLRLSIRRLFGWLQAGPRQQPRREP